MIACSRKQCAIIAVAVTIVAVFFGCLYLPLTKKLSGIKAQQRQHNIEAAQLSADTVRLPALSDQLKEMRAKAGNFSAQVPATRQLGEFLQSVAKIMNELSLQNQLVQPGQAINSGDIRCIPVDIQCEGNLRQIFGLLKSLEAIDRAIRFENIELSTDRAFTGKVNLHSKLYIYYIDSSEADI
jgi:Tfp pilus assembly protein PilO